MHVVVPCGDLLGRPVDGLELALARRVHVRGLARGRVDPEQLRRREHVQRQLQHPPALQLAGLLVA